jgi:hypothetical protein
MSAGVGVAACAGGGGDTGENENGAGGIEDREPDGGGDGGGDGGEPDGGGGGGGEECPFGPPQDPSALPECCEEFNGGAHCVPGDQVSPDATKDLAACDDGASYCVPDPWIEGQTEVQDCDAGALGPGACVSPCLPEVGENADILEQGTCAKGELCVPCNRPNGEPTGACDIDLTCEAPDDPGDGGDDPDGGDGGDDDGSDDGTDDGSDDGGDDGGDGGAEACCDDRGTCVSEEAAGEDADKLLQDSCSQEGELCAPNDLIDDSYEAEPCESTIFPIPGVPPLEGACMHDCLANTDMFNEDGCGSGFKCVPCEFPPFVETGACDYL